MRPGDGEYPEHFLLLKVYLELSICLFINVSCLHTKALRQLTERQSIKDKK